jgi:proteasome beta subunit
MEYEQTFKKGTTTIGLLCSDGVVLAAEKRATMGNLIANKEVEKIVKIQDHLGLTVAGSVADAQTLGRILKSQCSLYDIQRGRKMSVDSAATLLGNILQASKYFPYWVQILLGGFDTQPRLYSLDLLGSVLPEKLVSTGSGSPTAYGVLEDKYKENKPVKDNLPIAVRAVKAAMERDSASGNGIDVAVITKTGFKPLTKEEISELMK